MEGWLSLRRSCGYSPWAQLWDILTISQQRSCGFKRGTPGPPIWNALAMTLRMLHDAVRKAFSDSAGMVRRGGFENLTTDCERFIGSALYPVFP